MANEQVLQEKLKFLEEHYDALLYQTLQALRKIESGTTAQIKEQGIQELITQIEFALEELHPVLSKFREDLSTNHQTQRRFNYDVPVLPSYPLLDNPLLATLQTALLNNRHDPNPPILLLEAAGGMGKSLLVARLTQDPDIQQAYPDGTFWIALGREPDIQRHYLDLAVTLGQPSTGFIDLDSALAYMHQLFMARRCLIVLDDAADIDAVLAFYELGPHCRLLITSTDPNLRGFLTFKNPNTQCFTLSALTATEAQQFFLARAGLDPALNPAQLPQILEACTYTPLALQLAASVLAAQTVPDWDNLLARLQDEDCEFPAGHHRALMQALHLYLETLGDTGEYYLALAVFVDYTQIPNNSIVLFWNYMFSLSERQTQELLTSFAESGLLHLHNPGTAHSYVSLHSFQHDYMLDYSDLDKLHGHLLSAYSRQATQGWSTGPNDGYFYQHLCQHLMRARRHKELKSLLLDFTWIQAKMQAASLPMLIGDYDLLDDPDLLTIQRALFASADELLERPQRLATELLDQLWEKSRSSKDLQALLNQTRETVPAWEAPLPEHTKAF